jgi:hypothetical protein
MQLSGGGNLCHWLGQWEEVPDDAGKLQGSTQADEL